MKTIPETTCSIKFLLRSLEAECVLLLFCGVQSLTDLLPHGAYFLTFHI